MTEQQRDEARVLLAVGWQGKAKAGAQDATLTLTSTGTHSCAARAESTDGQTLESEFDNEATHAEMGIVGRTEAIRSLQIEKEPCPRCAVVLNALGLSDRVTYKKSGQKDNPTWRFPATWEQAKISGLLGIDEYAASDAAPRGTKRSPGVTDADHQVLSTYFRTNKWW